MTEKELHIFGYGFFLGLMWAGFPVILLGHPYIGMILCLMFAALAKCCLNISKGLK
jgi:hypothetical protein